MGLIKRSWVGDHRVLIGRQVFDVSDLPSIALELRVRRKYTWMYLAAAKVFN